MRLIPEIVVKSGAALSGTTDPAALIRRCAEAGAATVQLRDFGTSASASSVGMTGWMEHLVASVPIGIQLDCSGVDPHRLDQLAALRLDGFVLDARAVADPSLLRWAIDVLGNRLGVEVQGDGPYLFDAPRGHDAMSLVEAVQRLDRQGVPRVIYRDMTGERLPRTELVRLAGALSGELWVADAVRDILDLEELVELALPNVAGAIVGSSVFDDRMDLGRAFALLSAT